MHLIYYLFLDYFHFTSGSAIALMVSYLVMPVGVLLYIVMSGVYKEYWDGWTIESLRDWGPLLRLALANTVMVVVEWFSLEVGLIVSGKCFLGMINLILIMFPQMLVN